MQLFLNYPKFFSHITIFYIVYRLSATGSVCFFSTLLITIIAHWATIVDKNKSKNGKHMLAVFGRDNRI